MMIQSLKKKEKAYEVIIEGESYILDEETILNYRLYEGKVLEPSEVEALIRDDEIEVIMKKALSYHTRYLKSSRETIQYLLDKEISYSSAKRAVDLLVQRHLIEDDKLAVAMASSLARNSNGVRLIRQKLLHHQLDEAVIEAAIQGLSESDIAEGKERLLRKAEKKLSKYSDYEKRQKRRELFYRHGYYTEDF